MRPLGLETARLRLRPWREDDREPMAAINADPEVMRYFPSPLGRHESDAMLDLMEARRRERGFGFWAAELVDRPGCIGFIGLSVPSFDTSFTPCVEIGWRLARGCWNQGLATEGARAALAFGLDELALQEIVAFTVPANAPSRRVMEKIGMWRDETGDFDHPRVPVGHALRRHVLYRITRGGAGGRA